MRPFALVVATALLVAGFWAVGEANPPAPPVLQGDELGAFEGESDADYAARAARTLDHEEASFALVTFVRPLGAAEAAGALEPAPRVSALVVPGKAPVVVTEASRSNMRIDVITAAVVWANGAALRQIQQQDAVLAVEMLPADAVWGAFTLTASATGRGV